MNRIAVGSLLAVSVLLLFLGLGANTIWDANEAFYVDTPRHMVATGDYVHPVFNGEPRMNKPVLSYWIVAGFYQLFGVSVSVERLAIAVGAVGMVLAAWVFGRAVHSSSTGLLAALILTSAPRFVMFARRIFIDVWVSMFMALALACFVLAERQPHHRRRYLWLMYAAIGCGVLTKGPVALVFPAATIGAWLLLERRLGDLRRLSLVPGVLIVLAIVAPWWAVIYVEQGWEPVRAFWLGENLGRYTEAMQPGERDVFFYLPVVLGDLFPWTPFVVGGLVAGAAALWRSPLRTGHERSFDSAIRALLMLWVVWHVGVFSFSESKQDLYVFPIVPAVAALAAFWMRDALEKAPVRVGRAAALTALLMVILAVGLFWMFGGRAQIHQIAGANAMAALLTLGALTVTAVILLKRWPLIVTAIAAPIVVTNYVFALIALPAVEAFKPAAPIAEIVIGRSDPAAPPVVAQYRNVLPSLAYYLDRPYEDIFDMPTLLGRVRQVPEMYVTLRPEEFAELRAALDILRVPSCVVSRHTVFEAKLRLVVEGKPWPETWLAGTGSACR